MTTPAAQQYDEAKFKELILYISDKMADADTFGATMLNKVLFYSDFLFYAEHGRSITGAEYKRLPKGPVPRRLPGARDALINENRAIMRTRTIGPYEQKRIVPTSEPSLDAFSASEIKMVDQIIELLGDQTATTVSDISHRLIGWKAAEDNETIPYASIFLTKTKVSQDDMRVAAALKANFAA